MVLRTGCLLRYWVILQQLFLELVQKLQVTQCILIQFYLLPQIIQYEAVCVTSLCFPGHGLHTLRDYLLGGVFRWGSFCIFLVELCGVGLVVRFIDGWQAHLAPVYQLDTFWLAELFPHACVALLQIVCQEECLCLSPYCILPIALSPHLPGLFSRRQWV